MRRRLAASLLASALTAPLTLGVARAAGQAPDPHSHARPDQVAVTHIELDLQVDFEAHRLQGRADLSVRRPTEGNEPLRLDARGLEIEKIWIDARSEPVEFALGASDPILGQSLSVRLPPEAQVVHIQYRTGAEADALQWLSPRQTAGGRQPFLFTQSQAILARTWVPCQDTPGVRFTYSATVRVPPGLLAVMSAENPSAARADGVYRFEMKQPIPSYLLALAVGELEFRELGPRSGVYAEKPVVDRAAWELADTEKMITAAEALYGPYRWGRYDVLVLPPSFPFGGMENPRLTFATPTILAGDRSLVSLVAHELAHSWSGNLVTNATWNDFWLNEGFTDYFENRIIERVYGDAYATMLRQLSRQEIETRIAELGADSRRTWLYADLGGDPEDYESAIVYNKGALLLRTLEEAAGRETWDAFLRGYFEAHAFHSMTTVTFLEDLDARLLRSRPDVRAKVDPTAWVYGPGIPEGAAVARSQALADADHELQRFLSGTPASELVATGWVTQQWQQFLEHLPRELPAEKLADLDAAFGFTRSGNSEIQAAWFLKAISSGYAPAEAAERAFLLRVGRRKFLKPIYAEMAKTSAGKARAREIYAAARSGYHSVSQNTIDKILDWTESPAAP